MKKNEAAISIELLDELLTIHPQDGDLFWKARLPRHFVPKRRTAEHSANNWNCRYAGAPALNCVDQFGHLTGRIQGKLVYAHRVVYAMTHGHWPFADIDHINGNGADNRPCNLRDVTHQENLRNQRRSKNNTSGTTGVNFFKRDGNWMASITVNRQSKHLGYFDSLDAAVLARKQAERIYGFHENHGRKAA